MSNLVKTASFIVLITSWTDWAGADIIFSESFGSLANGTEISNANTNFNYIRVGSGGGQITAQNPGSFSGASMRLGGSTSSSLNGVGITDGLGDHRFLGLSFDFRAADTGLGDLVITSGTGDRFSGNSQFATDQLFFGVQFNNGAVEYRQDDGWEETGFNLADDTSYGVQIFGNDSGSSIDYGVGTVASGKMDILINGTSIADDVLFANNVAADAFRIYQVGGGQVYEIDNLQISAVPEPSQIISGVIVLLIGFCLVRRRMASARLLAGQSL